MTEDHKTLKSTATRLVINQMYGFKMFQLVLEEDWADPETKDVYSTLYTHDDSGTVVVCDNKTIEQELTARALFNLHKRTWGHNGNAD